MRQKLSDYPYCKDEFEILKEKGSKRLIQRFFKKSDGKEDRVDYAIQRKMIVYGEERWIIDYYNVSKSKVERRFLGL